MSNAAQKYHAYGAGLIQVGVGVSNALVTLGYSEKGIILEGHNPTNPVYSDLGGPMVPVDYQYMGEFWTVDIEAVAFVENVRRALRGRQFLSDGTTRAGEGVAGPRGQLVGTGGLSFSLAIVPAAIYAEDVHYFATAMLDERSRANLGTEYMKASLRFICWPFIAGSATTASGTACMARALPG